MQHNCSYDELVDIHKLVPHPQNPNKHPEKQIERLAKIIDYQGQRSPVIVCKETGFIIVGHGRLEAMKKLGWDKVAVNYQTFKDEAQRYAHMTADNAIAEWASLDLAQINADMLDLGPELDLELLGIEDFVLEPIEKLDPGLVDEDDVPEVSEPITKRGDVWLLGDHRVMCGDSTMIDDVEKLMAGEKADMVFTDPPYNQSSSIGGFLYKGRESRKKLSSSDNLNNFDPKPFFQILNILKIQTEYIFCSKNLIKDYINNFDNMGRNWNLLIMKKKNPIPQKNNTFLADVEYLFFSRVKGAYWKNDCPFEYYHRVREINVKPGEFGHPTEKQVSYIAPYFEISSKPRDIILDLFMGSGTTLVASEKTNRKCYGMELDEHYCDVIVNRWQNYTGKKAVLESNGKTYDELKDSNVG